jgi:hypothetical protein
MEAVYTRCIFCDAELPPPESRRRGEHIIPSHIYGSVCIKDVCARCNRELGATADVDVLKDARLVSAVLELGLEDIKNRLLEHGQTTFEDVDTGQILPGRIKDGSHRLHPYCKGEIWSVPEEAITQVLGGSLAKDPPSHLTDKQAVEYLKELITRYEKIQPGETVHDGRIGIGLRKATGKVSHKFETEVGAGKRLASKIAFEILHYFLPLDRVESVKSNLDQLATFAKTGEGNVASMVFYPLEDDYPAAPDYRHTINVYYEDRGIIVDVLLFGSASYRVRINQPTGTEGGMLRYENEVLDMVGMMMTFEPDKPRMKYWAKRIHGEKEPQVYEAAHL